MKARFQSIKFKLLFGGVLIVLVPLICVGWFSYSKANHALFELSKEQAHGTAKDLARATHNKLMAEVHQAKVMAAQQDITASTAF